MSGADGFANGSADDLADAGAGTVLENLTDTNELLTAINSA
jgi:hypothetical protein